MERIAVYTSPTGPVAEAYRELCTNVLAMAKGTEKIIEVAGVADGNNASVVIANLAAAMAQSGKNVLLADCNLRKPVLHELLALQNPGLTDCLAEASDFKSFIQATAQNNLHVLTAGTDNSPNPAETLLSEPVQSLLKEAKAAYDVVLLNVPPVGTVNDAVALGTKTDGVLLVLAAKKDKIEQVQNAKDILAQAGVPVLGCVMDKV